MTYKRYALTGGKTEEEDDAAGDDGVPLKV
jgi:hypothetical protein